MPQKSAFLGGDLRSGTSWAMLQQSSSLATCEWVETKSQAYGAGQAAEPENRVEKRVRTDESSSSCRHIGVEGSMKLEFVNDRLMRLEFSPGDFAAYRASMENELKKGEAVKEEVRPRENTIVLEDGTRVVIEESYSLRDRVSVRVVRKGEMMTVAWSDLDLGIWAISL